MAVRMVFLTVALLAGLLAAPKVDSKAEMKACD
jgi:hypothetical protein